MSVGLRYLALIGSVFLVSVTSPQLSEARAPFVCPSEDIINGCDGGESCLYSHWDPRYFIQCDQTGKAFVKSCPKGLEWNSKRKTCDWPQNANIVQGPLTASPATLLVAKKQLIALHADLSLIGEKVTFKTLDGMLLCEATTGENGVATCSSPAGLSPIIENLRKGYMASYAGNPAMRLAARSARGVVK